MTFDEIDEETTVSQNEAIREILEHSVECMILANGDLYCCDSNVIIDHQDENGEYNAKTILDFLGY